MFLALLFLVILVCCGYAVLRPLGLLKGPIGLALLAPTGVAAMAVLGTWSAALHLPGVAGVGVLALTAAGFGFGFVDRIALRRDARVFWCEQRGAAVGLELALLVPVLAMGISFLGVQVPLSPHDGAFHAEAADALRRGVEWSDWYPPGVASMFAAVSQLLPWLDGAQASFELGMTFSLLAPSVVFGLGWVVWRSLPMASNGALLIGLTYLYPYFPQIWSGWPLLLGTLLALAVWIIALQYVEQPGLRWAALAGGLLGGIVLVHGTELYTLALILAVVALANWRRLQWLALARHLALAGAVALVIIAPYLPLLLHWAGTGGAYSVGLDDGQALEGGATSIFNNSLFAVFLAEALGIDLPIRLVLVCIGLWWAFRQRTGRAVVVVGAVFLTVALIFSGLNGLTAVRQVYAATFPWGMHYRVLMLVAIAQALLGGAGYIVARRLILKRLGTWGGWTAVPQAAGARRVRRMGRVLVATWGVLSFAGLVYSLNFPARMVDGYSTDDAVAMRWLRTNVPPGEVVVNDGFADAGVWAPFKAGVRIVLPRILNDGSLSARTLVVEHIGQLDRNPEAARVACAFGVRFVYYGAKVGEWDTRRFPPLEELRASAALEEVFSNGDAVIFRVRQACPATG